MSYGIRLHEVLNGSQRMDRQAIGGATAIVDDHETLMQWRRRIHAHPELGFEEHETGRFVTEKLEEVGVEVFSGIGKTGIVGRLTRGKGGSGIGLRADLDALSMSEENEFPHKSIHAGKFHGCGHDGHTVMLLAAARQLALYGKFNGTVHFIFQPAEEGLGGARSMINDGLFEKFRMDSVYAMHNMPSMAAGSFAMRSGPFMAAFEKFDILVTGVGAHGALPHFGIDPMPIAAQILLALQTIVSRNIDPLQAAVLSITQIHAGDAYNVIPSGVVMKGSIRYFDDQIGKIMKEKIRKIVSGIAKANSGKGNISYSKTYYPPLVNDDHCTNEAYNVAVGVAGFENVSKNIECVMGSDDFSHMLLEKPGCYVAIGNGVGSVGGCMVHHPEYDFNDEILETGARFWVNLVQDQLK